MTETTRSAAPLMLGIAVLAILGGGSSAWFVMQRGKAADGEQPGSATNVPRYVVHLEGFTVNLADPEETHFLRLTIDLGFNRIPPGTDKEHMAGALPTARMRDAVLSVLTACKADVLLTADGKSQLKKNLLESLSHAVPEMDIRDIYFTEFLVQR